MAFALGFAGGFADEDVHPVPTTGPASSPLWVPDVPSTRRKGRATIRLKVTVAAWGSEGGQRSRHTIAADVRTAGGGTSQTRSKFRGDMRARHGHASVVARKDVLTHVGDPLEDDQLVLLAVAALISGEDPMTTGACDEGT